MSLEDGNSAVSREEQKRELEESIGSTVISGCVLELLEEQLRGFFKILTTKPMTFRPHGRPRD